ncbi:MAG: gas vesicle protein [Candidatus Desulfaltia sp.]|nr:gas vesicle protein [Candidatus Desulfaltia sp.]
MEPQRNTNATLVDLLDRVLDKGLVIHADLIVSVAGIPLIGVNLRAALAGMETMLKYGVMQAWDEKSRAWEREHRKKAIPSLVEGEEIVLKMYGSYYYSKGIYAAWKPGYFYLTDKRLILHRQDFDEITFQIPLEEIKALIIKEEEHFVKEKQKQVLYLLDKQGRVHRLSAVETNRLKDAIEQKIKDMGFYLEENPVLPEVEDEQIAGSLMEEERVVHRGKKVWYLVPAEGIQQEPWRPGHLYLTNKRLCWWYDFEKKLVFDVSIDRIINAISDIRKVSGLDSKKERVLDIIYGVNSTRKTASFAGKEIDEWAKVLKGVVSVRSAEFLSPEMETCPECGKEAPVKELLGKGCSYCNWVSPLRNSSQLPLVISH